MTPVYCVNDNKPDLILSLVFWQGPQVPPLSSHHLVAVTHPGQLSHTWPHHLRQRWAAATINLPPRHHSLSSTTMAVCLFVVYYPSVALAHGSCSSPCILIMPWTKRFVRVLFISPPPLFFFSFSSPSARVLWHTAIVKVTLIKAVLVRWLLHKAVMMGANKGPDLRQRGPQCFIHWPFSLL